MITIEKKLSDLANKSIELEHSDKQVKNYQAGYDAAEQKYKKMIAKVQKKLIDLADSDAYGDYQLGYRRGIMEAHQIIDKCN